VAAINKIDDHRIRYKTGLAVAYLNNYAPTWAWRFWDKEKDNPSDDLLAGFFSRLSKPEDSLKLIVQWLTHHMEKYEEVGNQRNAGLLRNWINKFLMTKD
jgi:hypothetical protein